MREGAEAKGIRYLGEARLRILRADGREIDAECRGDGAEVYRLGYRRGGFWCECPSRGRCAHLVALMRVTVAPSSARVVA
jgi:uncharacterized Zn finger protein